MGALRLWRCVSIIDKFCQKVKEINKSHHFEVVLEMVAFIHRLMCNSFILTVSPMA